MVEMLGIEQTPVTAAHPAERASDRPRTVQVLGRERVDQLQAARAFFRELASLPVGLELGCGRRAGRPRQVEDEELQ